MEVWAQSNLLPSADDTAHLLFTWVSQHNLSNSALLDEVSPITQWINTNLFIWIYSWQCEPISEFSANSLERKVTLLKGEGKREGRKRIINTVLSEQHGILLTNLKRQSARDASSQRTAKKASVYPWKHFLKIQKYHLSL